ncbi:MAG: PQQ-like beta-propeller repeat protein [Planctomycetaceae bacterium]|nr:PQQ-like beta-propeller repeat protein [Planctomycetaceae bacterium]
MLRLLVLWSLVISGSLAAADWPQFRGPNSDGHAEGPPTPLEWSDTKNVAWKVPIPGLGWSSPSIVGNRIYLTTAVKQGEGLSLRALALDTDNGAVVWDREVRALQETPSIHTKNSHASPTPLVRERSVFVHFGPQGMARLSAEDGRILWTCTDLVYPPVHGNGGTPVMRDGKLVVVCDGSKDPYVAAVDAETGKVAWKTPRSVPARLTHSFVTAAIATVDGKPQVLAPGPDHLGAYDLETGKELWKVLAKGWSVVPQPTIGHGLVIYNHDYDHPELMAVRLGGAEGDVTDSHVVWRIKRGAPSTPTPLLVGDELYFVSDAGIASCADAKTGKNHWIERFGGNYSASPVYANGRILFLNETGLATWVKPGTTFEQLGTNEVPGKTFATPAFSNAAMYLRTDEFLYKISESRN